MKKHTIYTIAQRRKREEKTNFRSRLRLLLSHKPRLVVRISSKNALAQIVTYAPAGDLILASASTKQLLKLGWKGNSGNLSAAYLLGLMIAKNAKKAKVAEAVFDIGMQTSTHGSRIYAMLKGAIDGGLDVPHSEEAFPDDARIKGKHIAAHAKDMKAKAPDRYKKYFSAYLKSGLNPEDLESHFDTIKKKIEAL
jgi:large subunit ribosomal protein L18